MTLLNRNTNATYSYTKGLKDLQEAFKKKCAETFEDDVKKAMASGEMKREQAIEVVLKSQHDTYLELEKKYDENIKTLTTEALTGQRNSLK